MKTSEEIEQLYASFPPGNRTFEEILFPDTPHRFYMDIEKGFAYSEQAEVDMDFMKNFLYNKFIPLLCDFFQQKLNIHCDRSHWYTLDASKVGVKFSVHLVLNTDQNHYCRNRIESWIIACLLHHFCESLTDSFEEFGRWYQPNGPDAKERVIDFSVYSEGQRNMRMLGCCKPATKLGSSWLETRPLLPLEQNVDWKCFIATLNEAPLYPEKYKTFQFTVDILKEVLDSRHKLFNRLRAILSHGNARVTQQQSLHFTRNNDDDDDNGEEESKLSILRRKVFSLGEEEDLDIIRQNNKQLKERFLSIATKMLNEMAKRIHPGQRFSERHSDPRRGELYKIRIQTFIPNLYRRSSTGELKQQRVCFWSYKSLRFENGANTA